MTSVAITVFQGRRTPANQITRPEATRPARFREPAIILKNESSYEVSFSVVQEDKVRTVAAMNGSDSDVGATLTLALNPTTTFGGSKRKTKVALHMEDQYFLMRDERVGPEGTTVPFPKDCCTLRVLGFFREDSSQT